MPIRRGPDPNRILNYTTEVPVEKTVDEIKAVLRAKGARAITEVYDGGRISAVEFVYETGWGARPFLLPAKPEAVLALMIERHNASLNQWHRSWWNPQKPPQSARDQAERTAWRTIKDWVEAQLALMATRQVQFEQIFLPYALVEENRTMFDVYSERQKSLPSGA